MAKWKRTNNDLQNIHIWHTSFRFSFISKHFNVFQVSQMFTYDLSDLLAKNAKNKKQKTNKQKQRMTCICNFTRQKFCLICNYLWSVRYLLFALLKPMFIPPLDESWGYIGIIMSFRPPHFWFPDDN